MNQNPDGFAAERGFTVIEALIAIAIVTLIAFSGLSICKTLAQLALGPAAAQHNAEAIDAQAATLQNDAAGALAVFVPGQATNGGLHAGREVDFYAKSASGEALFWRYAYDEASQTLQRSDYDVGGAHGVWDAKTGLIDPAASYPPLTHITRFEAAAFAASEISAAEHNPYSQLGGLFPSRVQALPVRFADLGRDVPDAIGGNGVVQIQFGTPADLRVVHLAAGLMPTGFTVTGAPLWHAVVYRLDQSHRFLLGLAGKSHVFINARIDVSYDRWRSRKMWCDFNLLGAPDGLDGHDPHADYKPDEALEGGDSMLAACRLRHPLPPGPDAADNNSDADAVHPPLPGQTAPPCWSRPGPGGRCWPAAAPPDWQPPAPLINETPPPAWCAQHAFSPACTALGGAPPGLRR